MLSLTRCLTRLPSTAAALNSLKLATSRASLTSLSSRCWRSTTLAAGRRSPVPVFGRLSLSTAASSHDAKLSSLLDSELQYERSSAAQHEQQSQPSPPEGFAITERDGTRITLTRKCPDDGSLLEVSLDLNGSTTSPEEAEEGDEDPNHAGDPDRSQSEEAGPQEILSRPDLTFRVRKPSSQTCLVVRCSFPPLHISRQMAAEDPDYPTLSIDTVAMETANSKSDANDYELEADMLNDDVYKQLAEMLVHRGVTRDFENGLVQFCTAEEHRLYLRFLAQAKMFCDA